jgi:hypothetical protein
MNTGPDKVSEKQISFVYKDSQPCQMETRWKGCCCICKHRMAVYKHCCHSPRLEGKCVCGEFLGFYLCSIWVNYEGTWERRIQLCGEHGYCEMYDPIPRHCGTCSRGPDPDLSSYPCHECDARNEFYAWGPRPEGGKECQPH